MDSNDLKFGNMVVAQLQKKHTMLSCKSCKTPVTTTGDYDEFPAVLNVHVTKAIGELFSALDPTWLPHIT